VSLHTPGALNEIENGKRKKILHAQVEPGLMWMEMGRQ
jgi:hypothetical protein